MVERINDEAPLDAVQAGRHMVAGHPLIVVLSSLRRDGFHHDHTSEVGLDPLLVVVACGAPRRARPQHALRWRQPVVVGGRRQSGQFVVAERAVLLASLLGRVARDADASVGIETAISSGARVIVLTFVASVSQRARTAIRPKMKENLYSYTCTIKYNIHVQCTMHSIHVHVKCKVMDYRTHVQTPPFVQTRSSMQSESWQSCPVKPNSHSHE